MGPPSRPRKLRSVLDNTFHVLAIEMLCGCQGLDLLTVGQPGAGTKPAYEAVRRLVPKLENDRVLSTDIETIARLLKSGEMVSAVESLVGGL